MDSSNRGGLLQVCPVSVVVMVGGSANPPGRFCTCSEASRNLANMHE